MSEEIRDRLRAAYGENRRLTSWDAALEARCHNGVFVGRREGANIVFRGVPFAAPPVGPLRWKRPQPAPEDGQAWEALYNGRTPLQTEWPSERASYYVQGEDCLYLNVWKSAAPSDRPRAVMVFFHGGSYGWGGTADPLYDGQRFVLAHPEIVLITAGYRTGLMGFVDFSSVEGGEDFPDAPNLGLLDQIEALRWVRRNAAAFGGDPDNVTIFGESAGGGSVSLLPVISEARGLFRRVIAESGSVALTFSREECQPFTQRLLRESGRTTMDQLMAMTEEELRAVNEKINQYNNFPQRDGALVPEDLYGAWESGVTAGIDFIIGTNANEMNYWIGESGGIIPYRVITPVKFDNDLRLLSPEDRRRALRFVRERKGGRVWNITEFYNELMFRLPAIRQAQAHARHGGKVWMYYWEQPSSLPRLGACHAVELSYVFGNTDDTIYTGAPADEGLARLTGDLWASFAATGAPRAEGIAWPAYEEKSRQTLRLSTAPRTEGDPLSGQREALDPLLDYRIVPTYAELDFKVPSVYRWIASGLLALAAIIICLIILL